jgi:Ca2+-binding RTX toxin-like protein
VIAGLAGVANFIDAGAGDDVIYGEGADTVIGGDGFDVFFGGSGGAITLNLATSGIELVWGSVGSDSLDGSTATANLTLITQGSGGDTMRGGSGDDFIYFQSGDVISGGAGADWAVATFSPIGINLNMTSTGFENAWGSASADTISAASATTAVVIVGDAGNDSIIGGSAGDFLYGFGGSDTLVGGLGDDNLVGGAGNDVFLFNSAAFGSDLVWDFTAGDLINMAGSGVSEFSGLNIAVFGGNSVVTSAATGSSAIWVVGVTSLTAADFVFV